MGVFVDGGSVGGYLWDRLALESDRYFLDRERLLATVMGDRRDVSPPGRSARLFPLWLRTGR